mmetsp:Transcript_65552/g.200750  ORF Transcript_65552/g.200750 Transcript_65552/m.200750 type:complete len:290 (+) Transcript_65552:360-1229(+)
MTTFRLINSFTRWVTIGVYERCRATSVRPNSPRKAMALAALDIFRVKLWASAASLKMQEGLNWRANLLAASIRCSAWSKDCSCLRLAFRTDLRPDSNASRYFKWSSLASKFSLIVSIMSLKGVSDSINSSNLPRQIMILFASWKSCMSSVISFCKSLFSIFKVVALIRKRASENSRSKSLYRSSSTTNFSTRSPKFSSAPNFKVVILGGSGQCDDGQSTIWRSVRRNLALIWSTCTTSDAFSASIILSPQTPIFRSRASTGSSLLMPNLDSYRFKRLDMRMSVVPGTST